MKFVLALVLICGACSGGGDAASAGEESGDCYPNSTCNAGLVCMNDLCERPGEGGEAGPCYPNQTCDTGLVCLQDVCTLVSADAGVPDAETPDAAPLGSCSASSSFNYVLSEIDIPQTATESQLLGLDIDGDNIKENALGGLLGALATTAALDMQTTNDEQVDTGGFIQLFALDAALLTDSASAQVCTFKGASPSIAPCTVPSNLNTCRKHLTGTASFTIAGDTPATTEVAGSIASGSFLSPASPATTTAFVAISLLDATPVVLPLASARMSAATTASDLMSGSIGGGLSTDTVDNIFIPAFALSIEAQIVNDCTQVGGDCGCVTDSSGESLLSFFDTNADCSVTAGELAGNSLIDATLRNPDLDLLDGAGNPGENGVNDHLSVGFGFSAVSASF